MVKIKIYSGLTLNEKEASKVLFPADFSPPIQCNDIVRDIKERYNVVVIIDGCFHQSFPISINEIMDGLRAGLRVYGSSSMGALRAAELLNHGMIGYGRIFEFIKKFPYFREDYLGQAFNPADQKATTQSSKPYIDFHFNLENLLLKGEISPLTFSTLTSIYRNLPYPERHYPSLKSVIEEKLQGNPELLRIAHKAICSMGSQKKEDAIGLLRLVKADLTRLKRLNLQLTKHRLKKQF